MYRLLFFLLPWITAHAFAQNCTLQLNGEILDGETNEKLIGAVVLLKGKNIAVETDEEGSYAFKALCADSIVIQVSHEGYKPYSSVLLLKSDLHLDISLHAETCELASVEIVHQRDAFANRSTSQIAAKDLDKQRGKSLGEILKTLPGVDAIQTGPNVYKPTIQGFSGNRVVFIQNNVRLEGQNWGNDHAPEIDPFATDKITVVKGASALMYGPEAQSGAIVIAPYKAPNTYGLKGTVFSNFQSNNRMFQNAAQISISSQKLHGWHLHLQGTQKYGGNIKTPQHFLDNTASRELNGTTHLGYNHGNHSVVATFSSFNQTLGVYRGAHIGNLSDLIKNLEGNGYQNRNRFAYAIDRSYQNAKHNLLQLNYHRTLKAGRYLKTILTFQNNDREEYDLHRPKNDRSNNPNIVYSLKTYQAELMYGHKTIRNLSGKSGLQAFWQQNITQTTDLRLFLPNFESKNIGAYHLRTLTLSKTQIELGLRYDLRNMQIYKYVQKQLVLPQKTYHALSGSMSMEHELSHKLSVSYTTGYTMRPPAANELFSDGLHHGESIFILKNHQDFGFKTENSLSNTAGIVYSSSKVQTRVSLFYNRIQNFIYLKPTEPVVSIRGAFPTFYYVQGGATIMGSDVQNHWNMSSKWAWDIKASITKGQEQSQGDYLLNMPSPRLNNSITYQLGNYKKLKNNELELSYLLQFKQIFFPKNQFDISYNTVEGLKTFKVKGDYLPAPATYGLVNASFNTELNIQKTKVNIYLACNNLLNTKYRNYLNRLRYYTDEQGFNCSITAKIGF